MTTAQDEFDERRRLERDRRKARARKPTPKATAKGVRTQPCRVCGRPGPSEAHHIVPRSAWRKPTVDGTGEDLHDRDNLMPLCHRHHQDHHTRGREGRIPRRFLKTTEIAFVRRTKGDGWLDLWYPTPNGDTTP